MSELNKIKNGKKERPLQKKSDVRLILLELFTSPSCPYFENKNSGCLSMRNIVNNLFKKVDKLMVIERDINVDSNKEKMREYGIKAVPALIINRKCKVDGVVTEDELLELLEEIRDSQNNKNPCKSKCTEMIKCF